MNNQVYYSTIYGLCRLDRTIGDVGETRLSKYTKILTHKHISNISVLSDILGEQPKIAPVESYDTYPTFEAYKDRGFRQWVGNRYVVHGYMSNYYILCKIGWEESEISPPERQEIVYEEIEAAIVSLSLSRNSAFRCAPVLQIIQHGKDCGGMSYGTLDLEGASEPPVSYHRDKSLVLSAPLTETVAETFSALRSNRNSGAYTACRRWMRSRQNRYTEDAILDLCIALEALYLDGGAELNFRLAQRCAFHIANNFDERKKISALIKETYKIRSKIVHGSLGYSRITDVSRLNDIHQRYVELHEILRTALLKRIQCLSALPGRQFGEHLDDLALGYSA